MKKIFDERWTVEAYNDEGNIVKLQRTADICDAVELAKAMEEEYPRVDIITPKGSVFPRWEWRGDRMKPRPMSKGMTESEKDARSEMKPKSPLPWMSCFGDIVGADKVPVVVEISAQNADYIVQAANAYPKLVELLKKLNSGEYFEINRSGVYEGVAFEISALLKELGELPE